MSTSDSLLIAAMVVAAFWVATAIAAFRDKGSKRDKIATRLATMVASFTQDDNTWEWIGEAMKIAEEYLDC